MKPLSLVVSYCSAVILWWTAGYLSAADVSKPLYKEITSARIFSEPLLWIGDAPPTEAENEILWKALAPLRTNNVSEGIPAAEAFLVAAPNSPWAPSLNANLAVFYRLKGRNTFALQRWESAWHVVHNLREGNGRIVGDYVLAHWTQLLSSLGRVQQLEELLHENKDRRLERLDWQRMVAAADEQTRVMQRSPEISYRCGTYALMHVAGALGIFSQAVGDLRDVPSPRTGFSLLDLRRLAGKHHLGLVPVKRINGEKLLVPSLVHWKQNHYAAITAEKGQLYEVVDPTFGDRRWLHADVINAEASGYFLIPADRVPPDWISVGDVEAATVFGKGMNTQNPPPPAPPCPEEGQNACDCPPGGGGGGGGPPHGNPNRGRIGSANFQGRGSAPSQLHGRGSAPSQGSGGCNGCGNGLNDVALLLGMPQWRVSEPYISLWVGDIPFEYQPSRGEPMRLRMFYHEHETRAYDTNLFNFGPQWNCNWLTYVQVTDSGEQPNFPYYNATVYGSGGGERTYNYGNTNPDPYSFTRFERIVDDFDNFSGFRVIYPGGAESKFELLVQVSAAPLKAQAFLTERIDAHGNRTAFYYSTNNGMVLLTNVVDVDHLTNIIRYDTNFVAQVSEIENPQGEKAKFSYNANGVLTNITDVINLTSSFSYLLTNGLYVVTNLTTPYGQTTFDYVGPTANLYGYSANTDDINRAITVTQPDGGKHLFVYRDNCSGLARGGGVIAFLPYSFDDVPAYLPVNPALVYDAALCNHYMYARNTFYWGPRQYVLLSTTNVFTLSTNDYRIGTLRNWLHKDGMDFALGHILNMERLPSPDGLTEGHKVWYGYRGRWAGWHYESHSNNHPAYVAERLPDGGTRYFYREHNGLGFTTLEARTNVVGTSYGERTNYYSYGANNIDLIAATNGLGVRTYLANYNAAHQVLNETNAAGYVTSYTYDGSNRLSSVKSAAGLTTTNIYGVDGRLSQTIDLEINHTNSFTYANGHIRTHTDERGLTITNAWDALGRLTNFSSGNGSIKYVYDRLDLAKIVDQLGYTNSFEYDSMRRKASATDPRGNVTRFGYCNCGSLEAMTNAFGTADATWATYTYDYQGRATLVSYSDGYYVSTTYDTPGQPIILTDPVGSRTNTYNYYGLLLSVSNAFGRLQSTTYDVLDRATNTVDANGISNTITFDDLDRALSRTYPDTGVEKFQYSARGLIGYTNQLGKVTKYTYDEAGRKIAETNANSEVTRFKYDPSGNLTNLVDGKSQNTFWKYDQFGRMTNKVDHNGADIFRYAYDANDRLTNRWTPAKTNTYYAYDAAGNLTNVDYAVSTDVRLQYDALNRLTNMVDAVGTTRYGYTAFGAVLSEDGPWENDTVTYGYDNGRRRSNLTLLQPNASVWTQSYGYDAGNRLTNVTSPAGAFGYSYKTAGLLIQKLTLPSLASVTNDFDSMGQVLATVGSPGTELEFAL